MGLTSWRGQRVRVGIVGICGFGRFHAESFEKIGWQVAAAADRSERLHEVAAQFGARPYMSYQELLESEELDALSISLPPRLHPEVVEAAVAKGLPVLCEKPVAPDARGAEKLLAQVGEEARVAVGFSFRYNTTFQRLRELIAAGELGRITVIHARKCWGTRTPWRLEEGGGAVFVKDIHYYDLIPWLLGEEASSVCAIGGANYHDAAVEDSYQLLLGFPSGAAFHLDSAWWTLDTSANHFEVVGTKARAFVEGDNLRIEGEGARVEEVGGEPMLLAEIRAFANWVEGNGPRPPGLVEAARANRLAQRVVDALRS